MAALSLLGEWELDAVRTDVRHPFKEEVNGIAIALRRGMESKTVLFFEDPNDGYRSSAAAPFIADESLYSFGIVPEYLRVPVIISDRNKSERGSAELLEFRDRRNGKIILTVGTDNSDDYYPWFVCEWQPQNIAENEK